MFYDSIQADKTHNYTNSSNISDVPQLPFLLPHEVRCNDLLMKGYFVQCWASVTFSHIKISYVTILIAAPFYNAQKLQIPRIVS